MVFSYAADAPPDFETWLSAGCSAWANDETLSRPGLDGLK
jgi:hypothetical protein